MQGKSNPARPARIHAPDVREQAVVLSFVLDREPGRLTIPDLARTLHAEPGDFERFDAVERAVRDLTGVGLTAIERGLVRPTPAAVRCLEILESGV